MLLVKQGRHCGVDHFTLETRKAPSLSGKLHNPLYRNLDAFLLSWIGKVLDGAYDLFDDGSSSGVDALLSTATRKSCEQRLLTPYRFFACALVADVVAHREEERVRLVVATTQAKQEGAKDTVRDQL
jgi:hypothetical protein